MEIYGGFVQAKRGDIISTRPVAFAAYDRFQASQLAQKMSEKSFPIEDGWYSHQNELIYLRTIMDIPECRINLPVPGEDDWIGVEPL